jgi:hypothetical protein
MKHTTIIFVLLVFMAASGATAQSPYYEHCRRLDPAYQRLLLKGEIATEAEQRSEQRRTTWQKEHEFLAKTDKFVELWTALAHEYQEKGTFNVKKAKQVSKAFHDLEKSEGWPKTDHR